MINLLRRRISEHFTRKPVIDSALLVPTRNSFYACNDHAVFRNDEPVENQPNQNSFRIPFRLASMVNIVLEKNSSAK